MFEVLLFLFSLTSFCQCHIRFQHWFFISYYKCTIITSINVFDVSINKFNLFKYVFTAQRDYKSCVSTVIDSKSAAFINVEALGW